MADIGVMLALAQVLALLTYTIGTEIIGLPIPFRTVKAWGPTLIADGILAEFGLLSVSLAQLATSWISQVVQQSIPAPFVFPTFAISTIIAQLVSLDGAFLLLVSAVSATVILAPVASAISSVLAPALTWTTVAIVLWTMVQVISSMLPQVWVSAYVLGVVFLAIPLRLGRKFGTMLMSSAIVLSIGLPLMPSIGLYLEGAIGYQTAVAPLMNVISEMKSNPLLVGSLLAQIPASLGGLLAAVVIALIVFPLAYLFILSIFIRSLANVLGGAASGPLLTDQIPSTARDLGTTLAEGAT